MEKRLTSMSDTLTSDGSKLSVGPDAQPPARNYHHRVAKKRGYHKTFGSKGISLTVAEI